MKKETIENKKQYKNMRIISLDGSTVYRMRGKLTAKKDGKIDKDAFSSVFDESLETDKLKSVYKHHQNEMKFPYLEKKLYCRALVNLSFNYAIKEFEQQGRRYVRFGYDVSDEDVKDHICIRDIDGKPSLIAIEIPYDNDAEYAAVESPTSSELLGKYFEYDAETKLYKLGKREIPTLVKTEAIREKLYREGFDIDGIHYVRYKRSAGSSRNGNCLFIAEPLCRDMMEWSSCGLSAEDAKDQASWQAYIALTLSSIEAVITLPKKAIMIIPDRVSKFKTMAVCVKEDSENGLVASEQETEVENVIWDGEALLDESEFQRFGYEDKGMMLLRNRFFKTCAFNTNLQKWFKDKGITQINQLSGYTTARSVEDIKLVITESSLKYLKFMPKGTSYKEGFKRWIDALYEGKTTSSFGVVKTDKYPSLMDGNMAYTNYQIFNTLGLRYEGVKEVLRPSLEYLEKIKQDPMYLRYHIHTMTYNENMDYEILSYDNYRRKITLDMLNRTPLFERTEYYKTLRNEVIQHFKEKLKRGRIAIAGNYETLFGNPYEFLYATINKNYQPTNPMLLKDGEVYTKRFDTQVTLLCARSPHITMGNLYLGVNTYCEKIDRYFNLTDNIICVNAINSNIQQRLNGCDYDSDAMLVTSNDMLARAALGAYDVLGVPVCAVDPMGKAEYTNTAESLALLDKTIANNKIGEIVNLSQFLNSLIWHEQKNGAPLPQIKEMYYDVCILAVLSGMEIDKAKRMYAVNTNKVLHRIKKRKDEFKKKNNGQVPEFFKFITEEEDSSSQEIDVVIDTPLSYLYDIVDNFDVRAEVKHKIPLLDFFELDPSDNGDNDTHKKQNIINAVVNAQKKLRHLKMQMNNKDSDESRVLKSTQKEIFSECVETVSKNIANDHVLHMLLSEIDNKGKSKYDLSKCKNLLLACILYGGDRRLLSKVKCQEDYVAEDLVFYNIAPEYALYYDIDYIYGYPHLKVAWERAEDNN